ncbi:MAG: hypothetical protein R3286_13535 [Gammaproteobacteria bacterium]|nr:hypothetical protein [Gammaproteobacteria bacterium]
MSGDGLDTGAAMPSGRVLVALGCAAALALVLASASRAAEGDRRGFVAVSHADGTHTVRAWIEVDRQRTLFYAVSVDQGGHVTAVCSERSPIPEAALTDPDSDIDSITTWVWQWLVAKGHGRLLVAFWDSPIGHELAAAGERGDVPPACA